MSSSDEHWPRTRAYKRFLFSARSTILFFALVTSCCHRNTSPGSSAAVVEDGLGYSVIAIIGRLKSLIAFAISGTPLYYFWMWLAIASLVFWH